MGLFTKNKELEQSRWMQLYQFLKQNFGGLKRENQSIKEWIDYLHKQNLEQQSQIQELSLQLKYQPDIKQEIRQILDQEYHLRDVTTEINQIKAKLHQTDLTSIPEEKIDQINQRLALLEQKKEKATSNFRQKLLKKFSRNSKDYIKGLILSTIKRYEKISAYQLKEMLVDEQGLCSKSSFYRLLTELETTENFEIIKQGKEKFIVVKPVQKH